MSINVFPWITEELLCLRIPFATEVVGPDIRGVILLAIRFTIRRIGVAARHEKLTPLRKQFNY